MSLVFRPVSQTIHFTPGKLNVNFRKQANVMFETFIFFGFMFARINMSWSETWAVEALQHEVLSLCSKNKAGACCQKNTVII